MPQADYTWCYAHLKECVVVRHEGQHELNEVPASACKLIHRGPRQQALQAQAQVQVQAQSPSTSMGNEVNNMRKSQFAGWPFAAVRALFVSQQS
jgi:hypothetical protein